MQSPSTHAAPWNRYAHSAIDWARTAGVATVDFALSSYTPIPLADHYRMSSVLLRYAYHRFRPGPRPLREPPQLTHPSP
jgi:hypothetical protein